MIGDTLSSQARSLASLMAGDAVPWTSLQTTPLEFVRVCEEERVTGLVSQRVSAMRADTWPADVRCALSRTVRAQTATELLRQRELVSVLAALAAEGIHPIILKGTALAHAVYDSPAARPRADTDLLIRRAHVEPAQGVLAKAGYFAPTQCDGEFLFGQFCRKKTDEFGLVHTLDVHWRLSTQSVFADVLRFDEVAATAAAVPALGGHARMAGPVHALILACIHPVMHHRNAASLIWIYDIHLLASRLSDRDWEAFVELALARRVSAICTHQLTGARDLLGTRLPSAALTRLAAGRDEPSADYLKPGRHWGGVMLANLRGLPRWRDRLRLLREVALPAPAYMLQAYGVPSSWPGAVLLPFLYGHRLTAGGWKVLAGRK